jgi:ribosomal protein S18 acetylase RimI-like enzyme
MVIRPAESKDYQAYCDLASEADLLHVLNAPRYYRCDCSPSRPPEFFDSIIRDPEKKLLVAEMEGETVGVLHLEVRFDPDLPVLVPMKWAHISEIIVGKKHQRQGVGKALIRQAVLWAKEHDCQDLRLSVANFNEGAKDFYKSEGFGVKNFVLALPVD